jgi:hypothetical protein
LRLIHCHLIYGIHVWGSASASNIDPLISKQKSAIRIISEQKYNAHTEPLFRSHKILPLKNLITYFKLLIMFDYKYGNLPISFADTWKLNSEIRNPSNIMALRNDNEYYVPFVRLDSFKRFPFSDFP